MNKAFNEDGSYRKGLFYNTIGPTYISIALRATRADNSTAKLCIARPSHLNDGEHRSLAHFVQQNYHDTE
jgi:hypothetical protein